MGAMDINSVYRDEKTVNELDDEDDDGNFFEFILVNY